MLSYMLPVEEKSSPRNLNLNLNLNGNGGGMSSTTTTSTNGNGNIASAHTKLINFEPRQSVLKPVSIQPPSQQTNETHLASNGLINLDNFNGAKTTTAAAASSTNTSATATNNGTTNNVTTNSILSSSSTTNDDSKKVKMSKIGNTKAVTLKR